MSHWMIETKKQSVAFMPFENHGVIRVSLHEKQIYGHYSSDDKTLEVVLIPLTDEHIKKLQSYKSVSALLKYSKAHRIEQTTQNNGVSSTPCPTPDPMPTTTVTGQGIQTEVNPSTPCPLITTNVPYDGNGSSGASPLFIDTETTGLSYKDEIVEIAIVDIDENIIFESLVKPSMPIPKKATDIHGISNQMVSNAPTFSEIWNDFLTLVQGKTLIFYNRVFDTRMIYQSAIKSFGTPELRFGDVIPFDSLFRPTARPTYHCLMEQYAEYWGEWSNWHGSYKWQTLIKACQQQKIPWRDIQNHRASGDAIKTARLYKHLVKQRAIS